jgi:hypothetical protein
MDDPSALPREAECSEVEHSDRKISSWPFREEISQCCFLQLRYPSRNRPSRRSTEGGKYPPQIERDRERERERVAVARARWKERVPPVFLPDARLKGVLTRPSSRRHSQVANTCEACHRHCRLYRRAIHNHLRLHENCKIRRRLLPVSPPLPVPVPVHVPGIYESAVCAQRRAAPREPESGRVSRIPHPPRHHR